MLISFSLLYSLATTLGFHSRSVASSLLMFIFLTLKSDFKDHSIMDFASPSFSHLCAYQTARKNMCAAVSSSPTVLAWIHSPFLSYPSLHFFARFSDLSLCSMHPSPVPDAEAHGKDGDKRPQQFYFPNGKVLLSSHSCPLVY